MASLLEEGVSDDWASFGSDLLFGCLYFWIPSYRFLAVCTSGSPVSDWIVLLMQDNLIAELSSQAFATKRYVGRDVRRWLGR